ncbi:hypothetical protein, partial [Paraburkholderia sp. SIMBA_053]
PELAPDVVVAEYGWWQACDEIGMESSTALGSANSNYNSIVSGAIVDPLSGSSPLRAVPCDVTLDASVDPARRAWQGFRDFVVSAVH